MAADVDHERPLGVLSDEPGHRDLAFEALLRSSAGLPDVPYAGALAILAPSHAEQLVRVPVGHVVGRGEAPHCTVVALLGETLRDAASISAAGWDSSRIVDHVKPLVF